MLAVTLSLMLYAQQQRAQKEERPLTLPQQRRALSRALHRLACKVTWEKIKDDIVARFEFQSGNFAVRLTKESQFGSILYLFVFDATSDALDTVRRVCNQCNANSEIQRMTYNIDENDGSIHVHIMAGMRMSDPYMHTTIADIMRGMFAWQATFVNRFNELSNGDTSDHEKINANYTHNLYLIREQEIMHQDTVHTWRTSEHKPLTLKTLLSITMSIDNFLPLRLYGSAETIQKINENGKRQVVKTNDIKVEIDDIAGWNPADAIISDGKLTAQKALLTLNFIDKTKNEREITIHVSAEERTDETIYYRITTTLLPLPVSATLPQSNDETMPCTRSILLAYDTKPMKQLLSKHHYIWKEAIAKSAEGKDNQLTDEERTLLNCVDMDSAFNYSHGKHLFETKRYTEAITYLESAYNNMSRDYNDMSNDERATLNDTIYMLGYAYNELKNYRMAYYYLEMLVPLHHIDYTEEYINCLVNSHDMRALAVIDGLLQMTDFTMGLTQLGNNLGDDDEDSDEEYDTRQMDDNLRDFLHFLKRRKAYVLIDIQHYDEATKLLQKMLKEPENVDFATQELTYLKKLRGGELT